MDAKRNSLKANLLPLAVLLVPLVFIPGTYEYIPKRFLVQVSGFSLLAVLIFSLTAGQPRGLKNSSMDAPAACFLLWTGLSIIWAVNRYCALGEFIFLSSLVAIYFYASKNPPVLRHIARTFVFTGCTVSVYGILQSAGFDFLRHPPSTPVSTLGNANFAGETVAVCLLMTAAGIPEARRPGGKTVLVLAAALQAVYLGITGAKGAWAGFLAGSAVFILMNWEKVRKIPKRPMAVLAAALLVAALFLSGSPLVDNAVFNAHQILTMNHGSVLSRLFIWRGVLSILRESPLLGAGAGNFDIVFPLHRFNESVLGDARFLDTGFFRTDIVLLVSRAHNDFLETASELGITGLVIFLWLLFMAGSIVVKQNRGFNFLESGMAASVACVLVSSLFGFPLRTSSTALFFWLGLGVIAGKGEYRGKGADLRVGAAGLRAGALVLLGTAVIYSSAWLVSGLYARQARLNLRGGDWAAAGKALDRSIAYYRPNRDARDMLFRVYRLKGDIENSYAALHDILRYNPNHYLANIELGLIYFDMGRYETAMGHLHRAAEINPQYYSPLGAAYLSLGDLEKARHYILKQAGLGFVDEYFWLHLGVLAEEEGNIARAVRFYRKALGLNPRMEHVSERIRMLESKENEGR